MENKLTMAEENDPVRMASKLGELTEAVRGLRQNLADADQRRDKLHDRIHIMAQSVQVVVPKLDSIAERLADNTADLRKLIPTVHDHSQRITRNESDIKHLKESDKEHWKDRWVRMGAIGAVGAFLAFFGTKFFDLFRGN